MKKFMLTLLLLFFMAAIVRAENKTEDLALLLARTCVAEIGFKGDVSECKLMWSINQRNALKKQRSLKRQTKLFNSYWKCKSHQKSRPWIKHLNGYEQPKHWPNTMLWSTFRDKWIEIEIAAIKFVNERKESFICKDAMDYGAPGESPNMSNTELLNCGSTRQRYWRIKQRKKQNLY